MLRLLTCCVLSCLALASVTAETNVARAPYPVIYCTDLFHPHEDPDDHFDLATLMAIPDLDIKGIVLDQGTRQLKQPGKIPVGQIRHISGREVPVASGLAEKLRDPKDTGRDQKAEFQGGINLILDTLRASQQPVRIAAVGSMRDVVAAFNREPELFRAKVDRLLVFIGEASDPKFQEYNVGLDPHAYVGLMRSGLPVYWVPCFDGGVWQNRGHASFWKAKHEDLLRSARPEVIQYFIYALEHEKSDPMVFLSQPVDPARKARLFAGTRNLWCTAVFSVLADKTVAWQDEKYACVPARHTTGAPSAPGALFAFTEVAVRVSDNGVVQYGPASETRPVMRFEIRDPDRYGAGMTAVTAQLLSALGTRPENR